MSGAIPLALIWQPFFPVIPMAAGVAALLVLAVVVGVRSFGHRPWISVTAVLMRCALILALGLLLMGPSIPGPTATSSTKPALRVLIDVSASMQVPDVEGKPRFEFVGRRWLTQERLDALRADYDVQLRVFDESTRSIRDEFLKRPASEVARAGFTDLTKAVTDAVTGIGDRPIGGGGVGGSAVVVLSDGRDTLDRPMHPVGHLAADRSVPVYTVALGGPSLSRDVAVNAVPGEAYLFVDEPGGIAVRVMQSNAGRSRTVLHVEQGDTEKQYPVEFEGSGTVTIDVPILHDHPGTYEYRVWVDPIPGEAEASNNSQPVFVDVTGKRLRVLLLEGRPYWDTKFLAHALRKDSRIELTQVTQIADGKREIIMSKEGAQTEVPKSLEDLAGFDVVILGKDIDKVLDIQAVGQLPRYVSEHGGRVVFARGRAYDPDSPGGRDLAEALSAIEPVVFGQGILRNQKISLEPAGMVYPGFEDRTDSNRLAETGGGQVMPTLSTLQAVMREKAATRVLARARPAEGVSDADGLGLPAIVTMPYGRGMVVAVLGDGLWEWGLSPKQLGHANSAGRDGGKFNRFWTSTVRWLALGSDYQPGRDVSLRLSRRGVQVGDPIGIDLLSRTGLGESDVRVYVEGPGGERTRPAFDPVPGSTTRRRAVLHPTAPGVYRVVVETPLSSDGPIEAKFNCYSQDLERLHTGVNRRALSTLSELSGGRCLSPDDPDALLDLLNKQRKASVSPPKPRYLWDRGWVMVVVLLWAGAEWIVRRLGGLL